MFIPTLLFLSLLIGCPPRSSAKFADLDGDTFTGTEDCDDTSAAIYPGAEEVCDGVDNDCDLDVDEALTTYRWYPDNDLDGFGEEVEAIVDCKPPVETSNWAFTSGDCNDSNEMINPDGIELCNTEDDDCDDSTDEDVAVENGGKETYPDTDGDGEGDADAAPVLQCDTAPGYVLNNKDCDDSDATVWTGAEELCDTSLDDDCDSLTNDEEVIPPVDASHWCVDNDGDSFTDVWDPGTLACEGAPRTIVCTDGKDDNDDDPFIYPDAPEYCDKKDNNQNGVADEEPSKDSTEWYRDEDVDGHGFDVDLCDDAPDCAAYGSCDDPVECADPNIMVYACTQPDGYSATKSDCVDSRKDIHEGHAELCGDPANNDCDLSTDDLSGCVDYDVQSASEWFAGDVNGDGLEDVILNLCVSHNFLESDTCTNMDTGTTTSFCWAVGYADSATKTNFYQYNLWSESAGKDADERWVVDVDGDGAVDLVWVEDADGNGVNEWRVALADQETQSFQTQSAFWMDESLGSIHTGMSDSEHRLLGDVNKDGMADIVYVDGVWVYISFGTGSNFGAFSLITAWSLEGKLYYTAPDKFMLADVNKDGRDDLVVFFVDNIDELEADGTDNRGAKNDDVYNTKNSLADVDGAWLVLTSNGSGFDAPKWWLGVDDKCTTNGDESGDGCGNWADDVFVADVVSDSSADAVGFYEDDDSPREGLADGTFFGGASNATAFDSTYEANHLLPTDAKFAECAVRSTFIAEGSYGHSYAMPRAILFADVNGDGKEDALAFRSSDWQVSLVGSSTLNPATSWGP